MDLEKVLTQLRSELGNLDAAIESLERLRRSLQRRGRPPSWLTGEKVKRRGKRPRGSSDGNRRK